MHVHPGTRSSVTAIRAAVILAIVLVSLSTTACTGIITPSGEIETETRAIEDFDKVALAGVGTLTIKPGKTASLIIRADKNVMPYITTEVVGGELRIGVETRRRVLRLDEADAPEYELTAPSITAISNSGSGKVAGGPFSGGLFTIADSGSGAIDLDDVNVLSLDTDISGSGAVKIGGGLTGAQVVQVSGSGSFAAPDLESKVATVKVSGSGNVEVWATEGLDALVTGSGNVSYWGSPRLTEETAGSGNVKSLGPKTP